MDHSDAPIIQKLYDFYRELYLAIAKMPKKDKYALGVKLESITIELLELLTDASYSHPQDRLAPLMQASVKLDVLKLLLRIGQEIKIIDSKKYLHLQKHLQEIGRMLGGWIRSTKTS